MDDFSQFPVGQLQNTNSSEDGNRFSIDLSMNSNEPIIVKMDSKKPRSSGDGHEISENQDPSSSTLSHTVSCAFVDGSGRRCQSENHRGMYCNLHRVRGDDLLEVKSLVSRPKVKLPIPGENTKLGTRVRDSTNKVVSELSMLDLTFDSNEAIETKIQVCGYVNKYGKRCQRVGKCPFHSHLSRSEHEELEKIENVGMPISTDICPIFDGSLPQAYDLAISSGKSILLLLYDNDAVRKTVVRRCSDQRIVNIIKPEYTFCLFHTKSHEGKIAARSYKLSTIPILCVVDPYQRKIVKLIENFEKSNILRCLTNEPTIKLEESTIPPPPPVNPYYSSEMLTANETYVPIFKMKNEPQTIVNPISRKSQEFGGFYYAKEPPTSEFHVPFFDVKREEEQVYPIFRTSRELGDPGHPMKESKSQVNENNNTKRKKKRRKGAIYYPERVLDGLIKDELNHVVVDGKPPLFPEAKQERTVTVNRQKRTILTTVFFSSESMTRSSNYCSTNVTPIIVEKEFKEKKGYYKKTTQRCSSIKKCPAPRCDIVSSHSQKASRCNIHHLDLVPTEKLCGVKSYEYEPVKKNGEGVYSHDPTRNFIFVVCAPKSQDQETNENGGHNHPKPEVWKSDHEIDDEIAEASQRNWRLTPNQVKFGHGMKGGMPPTFRHPKYNNTDFIAYKMRKGREQNEMNPRRYSNMTLSDVKQVITQERKLWMQKNGENQRQEMKSKVEVIYEGFDFDSYVSGYQFKGGRDSDGRPNLNYVLTQHPIQARIASHCVMIGLDSSFSNSNEEYLTNLTGLDPYTQKPKSLLRGYSNVLGTDFYKLPIEAFYAGQVKHGIEEEVTLELMKKFCFNYDGDPSIPKADLLVMSKYEKDPLLVLEVFYDKTTSCETHQSGRRNKVRDICCGRDKEKINRFNQLADMMMKGEELETCENGAKLLVEEYPTSKNWVNLYMSPKRLLIRNKNLFKNPRRFFDRTNNLCELVNWHSTSRIKGKNAGPGIAENMRIESVELMEFMNVKDYNVRRSYRKHEEKDRALRRYQNSEKKKEWKKKLNEFMTPSSLSTKSGFGRNRKMKKKKEIEKSDEEEEEKKKKSKKKKKKHKKKKKKKKKSRKRKKREKKKSKDDEFLDNLIEENKKESLLVQLVPPNFDPQTLDPLIDSPVLGGGVKRGVLEKKKEKPKKRRKKTEGEEWVSKEYRNLSNCGRGRRKRKEQINYNDDDDDENCGGVI